MSTEPKYFLADNCLRKFITPNNRRIHFNAIDQFTGVWRGIFEATDPEDITGLLALADTTLEGKAKDSKHRPTAVREITAEEYATWLQKKTNDSRDFNPLPTPHNPASNPVALTGTGATVVESPSVAEEEVPPVDGAPVAADAALAVVSVVEGTPAEPEAETLTAPLTKAQRKAAAKAEK